ncbi:MAG: glycosyltransferase involved in cell wall biosynthesis [Candidatus Endobugula sp.]|jgi:glycosyltransferase involved in cell wall biosynthesis
MKILWLVNTVFPEVSLSLNQAVNTGTGSWMMTLLNQLKNIDGVEIYIVTGDYRKEDYYYSRDKIEYQVISFSSFDAKFRGNKKNIKKLSEIIIGVNPDVVHVFGTERFWGLVANEVPEIPFVVRLQGVLSVYHKYFFLDVGLRAFMSLDVLKAYFRFRKWSKIEERMISTNHFFEGQSEWDLSIIRCAKKGGDFKYFKNLPILRAVFREHDWELSGANKYAVCAVSSIYPYKGIHTLVKAISALRYEFPKVSLHLAGKYGNNGYGKYIKKLIRDYGLEDIVVAHGFLDEKRLAKLFVKSHVFVNPSFVENESLGMLEALSIGTPTVVSYAGGMPDNVDDKVVSFFPIGEWRLLAERLRGVFLTEDDALQEKSIHIRETYRNLLNEKSRKEMTMEMYHDIIGEQ